MILVGREKEIQALKEAYDWPRSQFIAIYGRRRVGKTYLVREVFDYKFSFTHTGLANTNTRGQLREFGFSLRSNGSNHRGNPKDWYEAFDQLRELMDTKTDAKKVIFLDEVPWMDAPRSHFISALEHFWNGWASARKDVLLIICGSSSSWIIDQVLNNYGGLYNRVNRSIHLHQFSLRECEEYTKTKHLNWNRRQIAETYMIFGGVPYYWSLLNPKLSMGQNIETLLFRTDGELRNEYKQLYASLFKSPEPYISIIEALVSSRKGLTREEIITKTKLADNGKLSAMLQDLIKTSFIRKYCHLGQDVKQAMYQLVDNFTLFYHMWIKTEANPSPNYWTSRIGRPDYNTWAGLAFERICFRHIQQITSALSIGGIVYNVRSWRAPLIKDKQGAQIDMIIDRADDVITMLEMKYTRAPFEINENYRSNLNNKITRLEEHIRNTKSVQLVMVSASGIENNQFSDIVQNVVTLDQLFT